jgi:hypothetical protein
LKTLNSKRVSPAVEEANSFSSDGNRSRGFTMRDVYLDAIPRSTITKATTSTCTLNPTGWSTDMAGANLVGIRDVFGSEAFKRVKTCEFHFKQNHNKKARELHEESAQEFKDSIYMEFHFIGSYIREYKKGWNRSFLCTQKL